ncbi:MAG: hypothetical protein ACE5GW_04880, partial [Planctomycetota bacterium]
LGGTCPVAAPTGLTCAATGADVDLAWMNPDPYTSVRVLRDGAEIASLAGDATSYTDTGVAPGSHQYAVVGEDSGAGCGSASDPCTVDVQPPGDQFIRGDVNADGTFNIADPVSLLSELFVPGTPPGPCADAGDVNDDGSKNIADAVSALSSLFVPGTPPPSAPHPGCGPDPSDDTLDCADFPPCP